jgi:geranylgeranyl diphosphate synthase, type I
MQMIFPARTASRPEPVISSESLDALLDAQMKAALTALDGPAPILAGMANYHLGFADADFRPALPNPALRGKRVRPGIAMLACGAAGGDPRRAVPLAAAVELLHNFTLVHDDIQDQSPSRRHRPTVWKLWGIAQAINAGDAMFAAAHHALYDLRHEGIDAGLVLRIAERFDRMTIEIVQGQALDLEFEGQSDVTSDAYLEMIALKTAVIVQFAAWAGALLAGVDEDRVDRFGDFGLALGIGFQVRDDLLGIWGTTETTGKAEADDIRRRKQSLPILMLRERASEADCAVLNQIYAGEEIGETGIRRVLEMLDRYAVRADLEQRISAFHDDARPALAGAALAGANPYRDAMAQLVDVLSNREH